MHALTLARQRLLARLQSPSTPQPVRLAHGMVEKGQARFLPVLSSALAQEILTRGYHPRTMERVYADQPDGLGLFGKLADRKVLDLPMHQALRERYEAAVGESCAAAVMGVRSGLEEYRMLLAPCGLGAEWVGVADRLRSDREEVLRRLRCWGVDPDPEGDLLPEARRRVQAAGLEASFLREDLRRRRGVEAVCEKVGPFHLVACLGASQERGPDEIRELVAFYARTLAPGGMLLIDRWQDGDPSRMLRGLGVKFRCCSPAQFQGVLSSAGLVLEREHLMGEAGCILAVARKPAT